MNNNNKVKTHVVLIGCWQQFCFYMPVHCPVKYKKLSGCFKTRALRLICGLLLHAPLYIYVFQFKFESSQRNISVPVARFDDMYCCSRNYRRSINQYTTTTKTSWMPGRINPFPGELRSWSTKRNGNSPVNHPCWSDHSSTWAGQRADIWRLASGRTQNRSLFFWKGYPKSYIIIQEKKIATVFSILLLWISFVFLAFKWSIYIRKKNLMNWNNENQTQMICLMWLQITRVPGTSLSYLLAWLYRFNFFWLVLLYRFISGCLITLCYLFCVCFFKKMPLHEFLVTRSWILFWKPNASWSSTTVQTEMDTM